MAAPPLVWLPGVHDDLEHAVVDADVVRAGAAGVGEVVAVCSAAVALCSLATPTSRRCPDCEAHITRHHEPERGSRRRLPWGR